MIVPPIPTSAALKMMSAVSITPSGWHLRRPQARQLTCPAGNQSQVLHQSQLRQGARPQAAGILLAARRRGDRIGDAILLAVHEAVHAALNIPTGIRRRFSPLEKYLGEVRLQHFGIGRLTTEADIAVGTDHIQTCTPSSIAVV